MSGWLEKTLGDLVRFRAGTAFPKEHQGLAVGEYPFAKVSDMNTSGNEVYLGFAENYISRDLAKSLKAYVHKPGSIAFAKIGIALTTNRRRIISRPIVLDNNMMSAEPDERHLDSRFAYFLLLTIDFNEVSAGSALPYLTLGGLNAIPVKIPPLPEQREIAGILGALDDKIEVNRKTSALLEEMARALYRSWFVTFDPVNAAAEGRPLAHLPLEVAALFPATFQDNGLPEGWQMSTIGEVAEIVGGSTPATKEPEFWEGGHHFWATPKDLSNLGQPVLFQTERRVTDRGLAQIGSGLSPAGTVLLSSRAPIGYLAIAQVPVAVNQGFIAIRETAKISGIEAYCWCHENMDAIHANANGSTFQEISKKNFRPLPYVLAPAAIRKAFNDQVAPLFARLSAACAESQSLAALRDSLLPRLMSGELRVGAARERVEEVA